MKTGTKIAIGVGVVALVVGGVVLLRRKAAPVVTATPPKPAAPKPKGGVEKAIGWAGALAGLAGQAHNMGLF